MSHRTDDVLFFLLLRPTTAIGSYVAYWIAVIAYLAYAMYTEQRLPCVKRKQKTVVN